jgi:hypothetical protein
MKTNVPEERLIQNSHHLILAELYEVKETMPRESSKQTVFQKGIP